MRNSIMSRIVIKNALNFQRFVIVLLLQIIKLSNIIFCNITKRLLIIIMIKFG